MTTGTIAGAQTQELELGMTAWHWAGFDSVRVVGWIGGHVLFEANDGTISGCDPADLWTDDTCTKRLAIPKDQPAAMLPEYLARFN